MTTLNVMMHLDSRGYSSGRYTWISWDGVTGAALFLLIGTMFMACHKISSRLPDEVRRCSPASLVVELLGWGLTLALTYVTALMCLLASVDM